MNETNIMKWITYAGIAYLVYLFLRFRTAGSVNQISGSNITICNPNLPKCDIAPFVSDNPPIALASDYLSCGRTYRPAVSRNLLPQVRQQLPISAIRSQTQNTSFPYAARQCTIPPCAMGNVDGSTNACICYGVGGGAGSHVGYAVNNAETDLCAGLI